VVTGVMLVQVELNAMIIARWLPVYKKAYLSVAYIGFADD
jgi:hypothetical protein